MFKILRYIEKKINRFESQHYMGQFIGKITHYMALRYFAKIDKKIKEKVK